MAELQYQLIEKSGPGGHREGAGRKKGEETKRVRVPVGCLEEVMILIENYKNRNEGQESKKPENTPEIETPVRNEGQESKTDIEPAMIETKNGYVPAKFWWTDKDGHNVFWQGKGRQPRWFKDHINSGGSKDDLDIASWEPGAKWKGKKS